MFGFGMMEILLILAIALIVVGPQKLPELAKTLGRAMGEFKRSAQDLKRSMDIETTVKDIDLPKTDVKEILGKKDDKTQTAPDTGTDDLTQADDSKQDQEPAAEPDADFTLKSLDPFPSPPKSDAPETESPDTDAESEQAQADTETGAPDPDTGASADPKDPA